MPFHSGISPHLVNLRMTNQITYGKNGSCGNDISDLPKISFPTILLLQNMHNYHTYMNNTDYTHKNNGQYALMKYSMIWWSWWVKYWGGHCHHSSRPSPVIHQWFLVLAMNWNHVTFVILALEQNTCNPCGESWTLGRESVPWLDESGAEVEVLEADDVGRSKPVMVVWVECMMRWW